MPAIREKFKIKKIFTILSVFMSINLLHANTFQEARYQDKIGNSIKAIQLYKQSIQESNNNALANFYLAKIYDFNGDDKLAKKLYQEFLQEINTRPLTDNELLILADRYHWGDRKLGIDKDRKRAFKIYLKLAKNGNPFAQKKVSTYYRSKHYSELVNQDQKEALKWYNLAYENFKKQALNGDLDAYIELSEMHKYIGQPFPLNHKETLKWLKKPVELNYLPAILSMIDFYSIAYSSRDYKKAFYYSQKGSELGSASAMERQGSFYMYGAGIKKDYSKAKENYKKAIKLGELMALDSYIRLLAMDDNTSSDKEIKKLISKYCYSSKNNTRLKGFYCMNIPTGYLYEKGINVSQNYKKSLLFYEQELPYLGDWTGLSYYRLGKMYEEGNGVLKDYNLAISYYQSAIDNKYTQAKCSIVKPLYELKELDKAIKYAKEGYEEGFEECQKVWDELELYKK